MVAVLQLELELRDRLLEAKLELELRDRLLEARLELKLLVDVRVPPFVP